jgi:hypothetical protein
MAEHKEIGSIKIVTDSDNGYEHIGDVDGGFNEYELRDHIEKHGITGISEKLSYMQWQAWQCLRDINAQKFQEHCVQVIKTDKTIKL